MFGSESRQSLETGGQQNRVQYGEHSVHHRGLRPEHAFKGVVWELGRANCLLVQTTVRKAVTNFQAHEARKPRPSCEPFRDTKEDGYTGYRVRIVNSEQTRDGLLAVLVDHSTDGRDGTSGKVGN